MVSASLGRLFSGSYQLLAAQEVSSAAHALVLQNLLPGGGSEWSSLFFDTTDTQDNGFWLRPAVLAGGAMPLFVTSTQDASGRFITDSARAVHPPQSAHFTIGDFDFTLITLHLTFAGGDTAESAREMRVLLDYLDEYFQQPGHDPDVIICGDFNTPSLLSGQSGSGGITLDSIFDTDPRFQIGERRFVVTVHEPTSRTSTANGGMPNNNYDHFVFSADALEELVQARRVAPEILTVDPDDPELRLTSDHFPIVAFLSTQGEGIQRDVNQTLMSIHSVLNGASFGPGVSAGSWITIFGEALAPTTRIWRNEEIIDGVLPKELDGVRVLINGRPAAVFFISPTQLNVQAPDDMALGPVSVEVTREDGGSAMSMAELRAASPAFFLFDPDNRKYVAAVHTDGTFVGRPGLFGDAVTTRPAEPGDVILLFGTAFGPTEPAVPSGNVFSGAAPLKNAVRVLMGGIQANVLFAGLSGAGVNQLNVRVPEGVPSGDLTVLAETLGYQNARGRFSANRGARLTSSADHYSHRHPGHDPARAVGDIAMDVKKRHNSIHRPGDRRRAHWRIEDSHPDYYDDLHRHRDWSGWDCECVRHCRSHRRSSADRGSYRSPARDSGRPIGDIAMDIHQRDRAVDRPGNWERDPERRTCSHTRYNNDLHHYRNWCGWICECLGHCRRNGRSGADRDP